MIIVNTALLMLKTFEFVAEIFTFYLLFLVKKSFPNIDFEFHGKNELP